MNGKRKKCQFLELFLSNPVLKKIVPLYYLKIKFPVWPRSRLISAGLEPVLSHTETSCISSYYRQFYTNIRIKILKLKPVLPFPRGRKNSIRRKFFFLISAEICLK